MLYLSHLGDVLLVLASRPHDGDDVDDGDDDLRHVERRIGQEVEVREHVAEVDRVGRDDPASGEGRQVRREALRALQRRVPANLTATGTITTVLKHTLTNQAQRLWFLHKASLQSLN